MKKCLCITIILATVTGALCACGEPVGHDGIEVICTTFAAYDWARIIVGDVTGVSVRLLTDSGVDMHSYSPTVADIAAISDCDVFVYVGGESDGWVRDALKNVRNDNRRALCLLDILGDRAQLEQPLEGMSGVDHDEETEYDEHVWLSLRNAIMFCRSISDALCEADAANTDVYRANCDAYCGELSACDEYYTARLAAAPRKTLIFADRYPFCYFVRDYGLECYAAFPGCSSESDASFATIIFLAGKIDELDIDTIITIEGSAPDIARSVRDNTRRRDMNIVTLNSMQSVSGDLSGVSYLDIMRSNFAVTEQALGINS